MVASKDLYSYADKRVVVTGGASGVGAALVELLDELGKPEVVVLDVQEPTNLAPSQRWISTDLTDPAALDRAVEAAGAVDVLFNNAGVAGTAPSETVFAVNVLALRHLTNAIAPNMTSGAAIVNTSSTAGLQWSQRVGPIDEVLDIVDWDEALAWFGLHHDKLGIDSYSFSKECVQRLTLRLAAPFAQRGLRVNSVCPSPIDTPLLQDFRTTFTDAIIDFAIDASAGLASPVDIAGVLAFLGMDASSHMSGVNVVADRGSSAGMATGTIDMTNILQVAKSNR
jgi:NAD(P)-dependent dehydrogenase (short-subunit alcohol dehydrogenase family)